MIKIKTRQRGFTIIELMLVIAVICVLSFLVIKTYASVQAKVRNNSREISLKALQDQIEIFYSKNGYFPNLNDLNDPAWRTVNMKNLQTSDLVDPSSSCDPAKASCLGGSYKGVAKQFEYYATESDGITSCNGKVGSMADQNCAQYKLVAKYEGVYNGQRYDVLQNLD